MYTLRTVLTGGTINRSLGRLYSIFLAGVHNDPERFDALCEKFFVKDKSTVAGFLFDDTGDQIILWKNEDYFIMTEEGKTFDHIYVKSKCS